MSYSVCLVTLFSTLLTSAIATSKYGSDANFQTLCQSQTYKNKACFEERKIHLYETQAKEYIDARDLCWLKFHGDRRSDLVSIYNCAELEFIRGKLSEMSKSWPTNSVTFWTSGYSGFQMRNSKSNNVNVWLSYIGGNITVQHCPNTTWEPPNPKEPLVLLLNYTKDDNKISFKYVNLNKPTPAFPLCEWVSEDYIPLTEKPWTEPDTEPSSRVTQSTVPTFPKTTEETTVAFSPETSKETTATSQALEETTATSKTFVVTTTEVPRKPECSKSCLNPTEVGPRCEANEAEFDYCECKTGCCFKHYICLNEKFKTIQENIERRVPAVDVSKEFVNTLKNSTFKKAHDLVPITDIVDNITNLFLSQATEEKVPLKVGKTFASQTIEAVENIFEKAKKWDEVPKTIFRNVVRQITGFGHKVGCRVQESEDWNFAASLPYLIMKSYVTNGSLEKGFAFPKKSDDESFISFDRAFKIPTSTRDMCNTPVVSGAVFENGLVDTQETPHLLPISKIVMLEVTEEGSVKLNNTRARITLQHTQARKRSDIARCVFWNFTTESWSEDGCRVVQSLKKSTICECDHLTNFAVLMDIGGRETNEEAKHLLTVLCSTISMISLCLTVICLLFVSSLKNRRTAVTTNLCICLFVVNFCVTFGLEQTDNETKCRFFSMMLMYSISSTFLWMLLEGYLLYQMIILVFSSIGYLRKRWLYALGYGVPLVWLLGIAQGIGIEIFYDEKTNYFCWISSFSNSGIIWFFAGPAVLVMVLNVLIFILSLRAAIESSNKKKKFIRTTGIDKYTPSENTKRWLKGWTSLLILLGITWSAGLLYIHEAMSYASYVFIVLNGLQGFFIFLFEILLNRNARDAIFNIVGVKFPLSAASSTNPLTSRRSNTTTLSTRNSSELCMSVKRAPSNESRGRDDKTFYY